ncbi:MAG: WYL domain-containing transcriptional regulator [Planctomycetes bacterium]|nr:WYL domain-containing transcriptional regulator [Planctomycetota bacterium]
MRPPAFYRGPDGDYLSRWKRIHLIDALLREGNFPSASKLAKACGVSSKSIYRDIDAMRDELAAPIEYDASRKGFRYSEASFQIPATALSERDLFALMVTENAVAQYEGTPLAVELRGAFDRVLGSLPKSLRARHALAAQAVHFGGLPATPIPTRTWSELVGAILSHRKLDIDYFTPSKGRAETRRIDPYLLVVRDREWFLVGRTQNGRHFALFYLPRIRRAARTEESFEVDPSFSAQAYFEHGFNAMHGQGKPESVELFFPPEHAHIADERSWAKKQVVRKHRNGSATLSFLSNTLFEVARQVLRYGGTVEVREPASLRRDVREQAARMAQAHR